MKRMTEIIRNELRLISRSARCLALYCMYAIALTAAAAGGVINANNHADTVAAATGDDQLRWGAIERVLKGTPQEGDPSPGPLYDVRNPYMVGAWLGQRHAVKPPATFSGIAIGQSDLFPSAIEVSVLGNAVDEASITVGNPNHRLIGGFDLAFVIVFLFPMIVIGLNFDALSQERESKRISFYNAISNAPPTLLVGRLAARTGILLVMTLIAAVGAPVLFNAAGDWAFDALVWTFVLLVWSVFWASLVGLIAVPSFSPGNAFLIGLGVWIVSVIVGPSIIDRHISQTLPPPDRVSFAYEKRSLKERLLEAPEILLEEYYRDHPGDRPSADRIAEVNNTVPGGASTSDSRRFLMTSYPLERRIAPQRAAFREQSIERESYAQSIGRWAPGLAIYMLAEEISNNSRFAIEDFNRQADLFQQEWIDFFAPRTMRIDPFTEDDLAAVPAFNYVAENATSRRHRIVNMLISPTLLTLLLALSLAIAKRRLA